MNLGSMKTALKRYAGVSDDDPLTDWINAAMHEFAEAYPWPFLEELVQLNFNTVIDYSVVNFLSKVISAKIQDDTEPLKYIPMLEFETSGYYDPTAVGRPTHFTLYGDTFQVWPKPDATYTVRVFYRTTVDDLVNDADSPDPTIPTQYHYTIVEGAAVRALQAESEETRAETARGIFEDSIDRHITKLGGARQSGQFNQVRDVMGYGT